MLLHASPLHFQDVGLLSEFLSQTFVPLDVKAQGNQPFSNLAINDQLGSLMVTEMRCTALQVDRTHALADRTESALYKVSLQLSGVSEIHQQNRKVLLQAGQWALYDTTRPYTINVDAEAHLLVLQLGLSHMQTWLPYLQTALVRRFETQEGSGQIMRQMLLSALHQRPQLSDVAAGGVATALLHLIGAQLSECAEFTLEQEQDSVQHVQLMKLKHYIAENLTDPALGVELLCAHFRYSRRYLYKLFALQNLSPADYIQRQRLEACKQLLANPHYQRPVTELAYQYGFRDATAFSHAFRRRYGLSPTAWRQTPNDAKDCNMC